MFFFPNHLGCPYRTRSHITSGNTPATRPLQTFGELATPRFARNLHRWTCVFVFRLLHLLLHSYFKMGQTKLCYHPPPSSTTHHHLPLPTTSQNISTTTHHHSSPAKICPLPLTTTHHHSLPLTTTHHHPPPAKIYPHPPTTSQNVSTIIHHHPSTAKFFFIRNPFIRISSHCLTAT